MSGSQAQSATLVILREKENGLFSVLVEGRGRRNAVYALKELLNVAEGKVAFE